MVGRFRIDRVKTDADIAAVVALFEGYASSLSVDLSYQDFETEIANLPGQYSSPRGTLLLARDTRFQPLGCVGLRPLIAAEVSEMKRLFLLPVARGLGLGRAMVEAIIVEARRIGYAEMRLDTLPTMTAAIRLYERIGFVQAAAYYAPTPAGTVFMTMKL